MYCPYCIGKRIDWVQLECPECGADEMNGYDLRDKSLKGSLSDCEKDGKGKRAAY